MRRSITIFPNNALLEDVCALPQIETENQIQSYHDDTATGREETKNGDDPIEIRAQSQDKMDCHENLKKKS